MEISVGEVVLTRQIPEELGLERESKSETDFMGVFNGEK